MRYRLLYFLLVVMTLTSCNDFLDITPDGQIDRDKMLATDDGVEDALYGVYAKMRHSDLYGQYMTYGALDVMAHYLSCSGSATVEALQSFNYQNTNVQDIFESIWKAMYANISNVNSILTDGVAAGATEYPGSIYRGEALGLRAFMHFDLMRLFALQYTRKTNADGVPYATSFGIVTPDFESLADNYKHVIEDLLLAEQLLSNEDSHAADDTFLRGGQSAKGNDKFMRDRQIHFNLRAVQGTLARVYLTMGDKDNALKYALRVIEESGLELCRPGDFSAQMHGVLYPTETVCGIYYSTMYDDIVGSKLQRQISYSSFDPSANILSYYQDADRRGGDTRNGFFGYNDGSSTLRLMKLSDEYARQGSTRPSGSANIPGINLIKLCEMHYIAAECLLDVDQARANAMLWAVYDSRGVVYDDALDITLADINDERYREMIGEGQEFFNRKRQHIAFPAVKLNKGDADGIIQPDDDIFTVPIPEIEYDYRN